MFKSLNSQVLGTSSQQSELIEAALTHGFRGLHVDIVEMHKRASAKGMPFARRLIQSAKLTVASFDLPVQFTVDDDQFKAELEKLLPLAQAANELGCTRCLTAIQPADGVRPYHENFEFHRHRLADLCRILEPYGIRLGVRFRAAPEVRKGARFQFIHDFDSLFQLVDMAGSPNLGFVVDTWDYAVAGPLEESLRKLAVDQIVAVSLADAPEGETPLGELAEEARMLPGTSGRVDNVAALTILAEKEYAGPVMVCPSRQALSEFRRNQVVEKAGEAFQHVWQETGLTAKGKLAPAS